VLKIKNSMNHYQNKYLRWSQYWKRRASRHTGLYFKDYSLLEMLDIKLIWNNLFQTNTRSWVNPYGTLSCWYQWRTLTMW
jgi:hypothetical protein